MNAVNYKKVVNHFDCAGMCSFSEVHKIYHTDSSGTFN